MNSVSICAPGCMEVTIMLVTAKRPYVRTSGQFVDGRQPEVIQRDLFHHHAETLRLGFRPRPISRTPRRGQRRPVSTSGCAVIRNQPSSSGAINELRATQGSLFTGAWGSDDSKTKGRHRVAAL
jgi:hypothetical protein